MPESMPEIDRISPARRPAGPPAGYQHWSNLLFVHWRLPAEVVQPLLPSGLSVDTFDGSAWVGLVPFYKSGVRPRWAPSLPGLSNFCETNVRTYVHRQGKDPGVWFFSLEAANAVAVWLARWRWKLPYFRARMRLTRKGSRVSYRSERRGSSTTRIGCQIEITLEGQSSGETAVPGTLEHFLVERYQLYTRGPDGRIHSARVHHSPYRIQPARVDSLSDTLLPSNQLTPRAPHCHAVFSEGVSVEVFPLQPVVG
jgi:uncharacterized protein